MAEGKQIEGKFRYQQDSKRFHRFQVETGSGYGVFHRFTQG